LRELQKALEEVVFVGQSHGLGVFSELHDRPDSSEGLSARMGFDGRSTWVLLEALVEMKYLEKRGETYSVPGEIYSRLVDVRNDEYEGDFWQFLLYLIDPWKTLGYVLKNGKPDQSSYKNFSMNDFILGMDSPWKKKIAHEIADICLKHRTGAMTVIDVGGAPGTMAKAFSAKGLKTLIYDLPEAVNVTREELSKIKNITIESGDATKSIPEGKYDICFLGNLCHGQSPEDNARIIKMCHERTTEGGIIVIFDNLRSESYLGATLALHMITQSPRGDIYSREEYFAWIEKAGYKDIMVEKISDPAWQLVIGYKK
jgi:hypothetical protein